MAYARIDKSWVAAHKRAVGVAGQAVSFQRVTGAAPRVAIVAVNCWAIVRGVQPDTTEPARSGYGDRQVGGLTQGDRQVIVMADALRQQGFPLPLRKGDNVIIGATGEKLNITRVDADRRISADCIELYATGIA